MCWKLVSVCVFSLLMIVSAIAAGAGNPLSEAIEASDEELVRALVSRPGLVKGRDDKGNTPLHYAAGRCSGQLIELLLSRGADPNSRNDKMRTPLHWAAYGCDFEIVRMMIDRGGDCKAFDENGESPLYVSAVQSGPFFVHKYIYDTEMDIRYDQKLYRYLDNFVAEHRAGAILKKLLIISMPFLFLVASVVFKVFQGMLTRPQKFLNAVNPVVSIACLGFMGGFLAGCFLIAPLFYVWGGEVWVPGYANSEIAFRVGIHAGTICAVIGIPVSLRYGGRFGMARLLYYAGPLLVFGVSLIIASRIPLSPFDYL